MLPRVPDVNGRFCFAGATHLTAHHNGLLDRTSLLSPPVITSILGRIKLMKQLHFIGRRPCRKEHVIFNDITD